MGETALKVSSRRLVEPLPNVRTGWVSRRSLGRWGRGRAGWWDIMGSEAAMARGSRGQYVGGIECDIVDSMMQRATCSGIVTAFVGAGAGADKRGAVSVDGSSCTASYSG